MKRQRRNIIGRGSRSDDRFGFMFFMDRLDIFNFFRNFADKVDKALLRFKKKLFSDSGKQIG